MTKTVLKMFCCRVQRSFWLCLAGVLMAHRGFASNAPKVDFARDVQPIFIKRCYECHGPDKQKNDLRLDRKQDALRGGKSGKPVFVAGKSAESQLIERVT